MKQCSVLKDGVIIADKVNIADTYFLRLKGLLKKKEIGRREALLIYPCKQIHTFGMKFRIDAVFLSANNEVVHVVHAMPPGRISRFVKDACMVLELHEGMLSEHNIKKHDDLTLKSPVQIDIS
jgi:uncharacterized membrane protein (UPF0127 family)